MIMASEDIVPVEEVDAEEDEVPIVVEDKPAVSLLDRWRCHKNLIWLV